MLNVKKVAAIVAAAALVACSTEPLSTVVRNPRDGTTPQTNIYPPWRYKVIPLLPGTLSLATDVNDLNEIVGYVNGEAFWMPLSGGHQLLAHPGFTGANAQVINGRSAIGGAVINNGTYLPAFWIDRASTPINLATRGSVLDMNDRSEAVGWTTVRGIVRAYYWETATRSVVYLPRYSTGNDDVAWAINNDRVVVGTSAGYPVMWRQINGAWTVTRIFGIFPTDIDAGYGTVGSDGLGHANFGKPSAVGVFATQWLGNAWAVNGRGEAVGDDWDVTNNIVLAWAGDRGGQFSYLPFPNSSSFTSSSARGVNTCGLVVGFLGPQFSSEAVAWNPGC